GGQMRMNNIIMMSIIFLFVCIALAFIPYLTRKTENFGVSIPASLYERHDFKKMRKQYTILLLGIGLLFFLIMLGNFFFSTNAYTDILFTCLVIAYILLSFLLYLPFHLKMKKVKAIEDWTSNYEQKTIIDLSFHNEKLTYSNWYFVIPGALWIISILLFLLFQNQLPSEIPTHISFNGEIKYQKTTTKTLLLLPSIQLFLLVLFIGMNMMIRHSKQQIDADSPKISRQQNKMYRKRWSAFTIIMATALQIIFLYQQLAMFYEALMFYMNWIIFI